MLLTYLPNVANHVTAQLGDVGYKKVFLLTDYCDYCVISSDILGVTEPIILLI